MGEQEGTILFKYLGSNLGRVQSNVVVGADPERIATTEILKDCDGVRDD